MANMPFFRVIYTLKRRYAPRAGATGVPELASRDSSAQQPRQMFFSRAFISASSALIISTYFELSAFEAGFIAAVLSAGVAAGTAFSADGVGGAALS
jgi:hypothetical protein